MMNANGNRTAVAFDALAMVVGTAVMGKPPPAGVEGDALAGFDPDLNDAAILNQLANPFSNPQGILQHATSRLVYDLFAYQRTRNQPDPQPAVVYTLVRETHDSDPVPASGLKIQHSFSYSDGFGREIQKKIQAEPGPVPDRDPDGTILVDANSQPVMTLVDVSPRWVGNGWTVFNNKGKPVRQYEPFFTDTHRFEFDVRIGVSPVLFYDPVERVVATLHPNHTWDKVVLDSWRQETWDASDTVMVADPGTDPEAGPFFARLPNADYLPTWHTQRQGGALGGQEQAAADKAAIHAGTPTVAYADSLGRTFLTVAHNKFKYSDAPPADPPIEEFYSTHVILDVEGNQREIIDAEGRVVMRYDYGIARSEEDKTEEANNRIHQMSMESGERWMLNDAAGKPLYAWDSRNHRFRTAYDPLRRPTDAFLRVGTGTEQLIRRTVYGETRANPETNNLRGRIVEVFDQAGVLTRDDYDFKGNSLSSSRKFAVEYKATLDWSNPVPLETQTYTSLIRYDAVNRPTELTAPDNSVIRPSYNEGHLLEQIEANLLGTATVTGFITNIDYNAKAHRERIEYDNGVNTTYSYDPLTLRLTHLQTRRGTELLQDLRYTYDPIGNITNILDDAQQTIYFRNRRVEPSAEYTYDAIYRLIEATGREHLGQIAGQPNAPTAPDAFNTFHTRLDHPGDGDAMGTYVEQYVYDAVGNFLSARHRGSDPAHPGWTRAYTYNEISLTEPTKRSNRLTETSIGGGAPEAYSYDAHGNVTRMGHLPLMQWDYRNQLQATAQQAVNSGTPETTWYVYDSAGQRARKVTDGSATSGQTPTRREERLYLGAFEIYREYGSDGSTVTLERETLHVMDDRQRIALVEIRTQGNDSAPAQLIRYQFNNHLGSANMELDDTAAIISYEEYYPFGSTSYQAVRSQTDLPKRYRYTGKEQEAESGLCYHGARYYAPWLGRWVSADPAGLVDGPNLYCYTRDNPLRLVDPAGRQSHLPGDPHVTNPNSQIQTSSIQPRITFNPPLPISSQSISTGLTVTFSAHGDAQPTLPLLGKQRLRLDADFAARLQTGTGVRAGGYAQFTMGTVGQGLWGSGHLIGAVSGPLPNQLPSSADISSTLLNQAAAHATGNIRFSGALNAGGFSLVTAEGAARLRNGNIGINARIAVGQLASLSVAAHGGPLTTGGLNVRGTADLRLFGVPSLHADFQGSTSLSGDFNVSGRFHGFIVPATYTFGTFNLGSRTGVSASAHAFGLTYMPAVSAGESSPPNSVGPFLPPNAPEAPSGPALGYSYTHYAHGTLTHIAVGFVPPIGIGHPGVGASAILHF
jgi:RHS repeat-associated protein